MKSFAPLVDDLVADNSAATLRCAPTYFRARATQNPHRSHEVLEFVTPRKSWVENIRQKASMLAAVRLLRQLKELQVFHAEMFSQLPKLIIVMEPSSNELLVRPTWTRLECEKT